MKDDEFDVGYWLLDAEIVDSDGRRCGRVDDVELDGGPGEPAHITTVISGPGAFPDRLPRWLRPLAERIFGQRETRVPWSEIDDIDAVLTLKRKGEALGLGHGDDAVGRIIGKLPGS